MLQPLAMALCRPAARRPGAGRLWLLWFSGFIAFADSRAGERGPRASDWCCRRDRAKPFDLVPLQQPVNENLDSRQLAAFFGGYERIRNAFATHAARAADAVDVVVGRLRDVVVNNV